MNYTVIGKIAELKMLPAGNPRIQNAKVSDRERAHKILEGLAVRGGCSLKVALGNTQGQVEERLRLSLLAYFCDALEALKLIQFRVNFNEIEGHLTWEGFGIGGFNWIPVVKDET